MKSKTKTTDRDRQLVQQVHDTMRKLGATCGPTDPEIMLELTEPAVEQTHYARAQTIRAGAEQISSARAALGGNLTVTLANPLSGSDHDRARRR